MPDLSSWVTHINDSLLVVGGNQSVINSTLENIVYRLTQFENVAGRVDKVLGLLSVVKDNSDQNTNLLRSLGISQAENATMIQRSITELREEKAQEETPMEGYALPEYLVCAACLAAPVDTISRLCANKCLVCQKCATESRRGRQGFCPKCQTRTR